MIKKFTALLLSGLIVVLSVPFIKSNATDVTVQNTLGDLIYGYTANDMLSNNNYLNYYDTVNGYLKYCGQSSPYYLNNDDVDFGSTLESTVLSHLDDTSTNSIRNTVFAEVDGIKFTRFAWWRSDYNTHLMNCTVVGEGDFTCVNGVWISDQAFDIYIVTYTCQNHGANGYVITSNDISPSMALESQYILHASLDNQLNKYVYDYSGYMFYCEIPYYMIAYKNSSYPDGDLLVDTYGYNDWRNVYNAIGTDTTGFVIDRRTEHMINESSGGGDTPTIDSNLGVIGGSFDCLLSADSLNNQKLLVVYDLNNYTKQIKNTINLKLNYQFFCDGQYKNNEFTFDGNFVDSVGYPDSYNVNYSNYVTIDINKVFNNIYGSDIIAGDFGLDTMFQIGNQVNFNQKFYTANEFINSIMKIGGFSLSTRKNVDYYNKRSFWDNVADTVIDYLNYGFTEKSLQFNYNTSKETVFNDCYLLITMYLENDQNNTCSDSYIYKYNYLDGTVTDVGGFADDSVFSGNYPTTNGGSASYPSNNTGFGGSAYGGSAYGGSGGSAVSQTGDIYFYQGMSSIPYLLVDIPEDEWINKTPNLKTIFTDFKDALSEVKDDSILNIMSETYNYIPVPMWQYLTYGVSILLAIGIWRGITRR